MTDPHAAVSIRAHFERFPATVKGAFVVRGEDANPHQVVLGPARIVPVSGGEGRPIAIAESTLDIAPKQDVFVPFETPVTELEPGWYELECEVEVDGVRATYPGGKRFSVPWPRASTRRGSVRIGKNVTVGAARVAVEQLECAADHVTLTVRTTPPTRVHVALTADGQALPEVDMERDDETGSARVTAYPIAKAANAARVDVTVGDATASLDIPLP